MGMMQIRYTRNLFLRGICLVFLFAFASLYVQIPGLYGDNGILPARSQLEGDENLPFSKKIHRKPTLLWLAPYIHLTTESMMEIMSLIGMFFAFTGFVSQKFCCKPNFFTLWSLYYSMYQVGQTFIQFQWDTLLLEVGFLCIIIAPFGINRDSYKKVSSPSDLIKFWLVRWLLFRLIFTSPINKLSSGDPSWWNLKAMDIHFQSMCLPAPLAWNAHHLPKWFLKFTTAFSIGTELILPPLFLFPLRWANRFAFYFQIFLQLCIFATGNFNFYNILIMVLCISLLDDSYFLKELNKKENPFLRMFVYLLYAIIMGTVGFAFFTLFGIGYDPKTFAIKSAITFSKAQYDSYLGLAIIGALIMGISSFIVTSLNSIYYTFKIPNKLGKLSALVSTTFYVLTCLAIFTINTVPLANLHAVSNRTVHPSIKAWHNQISHLHISNSYGLFRVMTGVEGRPEVIIEGSYSREGPWKEINFKYKPGNINKTLPIVAPHQPRLDWQMWFAALGTYHQNPWLSSLAYRILTNQKEVLDLLDMEDYAFKTKAPTYLRAYSYKYLYTPPSTKTSQVWIRTRQEEYFPEFEANHKPLIAYLTQFGILKKRKPEYINPIVKDVLDKIRNTFTAVSPFILLWSLFFTGLVLIFLKPAPKVSKPTNNPKPKQNQASQQKNKPKKK